MGAPLALAHLFSILPEAVAQAMGRGAAKAGLVQLATATQIRAANCWRPAAPWPRPETVRSELLASGGQRWLLIVKACLVCG
jgi:hypothetical protein